MCIRDSIYPVPLRHAIQGVEEGRDALNLAPTFLRGLAVPRLVERRDARAVEQAAGEDRGRHRQLLGPEIEGTIAKLGGQLIAGRRPAPGLSLIHISEPTRPY